MYHTLLFFHVLAAFFLAGGVVIYSAFVLSSPVNRTTRLVAEILWGVGGLGTIVFGIATSTLDASGEVVEQQPMPLTRSDVEDAVTRFVGELEQLPPMVSANFGK